MARPFLLTCALAAGLLGAASSAVAYDGCGGGYGFGLGYMYGSLDYRVPYFAAHPPVYYSAPVPRTYGYSPFAYPPHFRTPEIVESVQPLTITNPYVPAQPSTAAAASEADQTTQVSAPQPLVILNPYVEQPQVRQASHSL